MRDSEQRVEEALRVAKDFGMKYAQGIESNVVQDRIVEQSLDLAMAQVRVSGKLIAYDFIAHLTLPDVLRLWWNLRKQNRTSTGQEAAGSPD